jgi:hypothetical protein
LQNMLSRVGGMIETFKLVENAFIDVWDKASSKVRQIAMFKRVHRKDKIKVNWDV